MDREGLRSSQTHAGEWVHSSFYSIADLLFRVSVQPPAAPEPNQTCPAELLKTMPLNMPHHPASHNMNY